MKGVEFTALPPMRIFLLAVCLLFAGCKKKESPIRIAINAWPGYELLFLAQEKGFFAEENLKIQFLEFGSLGDVQRAFEWGQANGMAGTLIDVILADYKTNRHPKIILVTGQPIDDADVLLAPPYIENIHELKGRPIGVEFRSLGMYLLLRALEDNHMRLDEIVLFPADPTSFPSLFDKGYIDAAVCYPPHSIHLKAMHPEMHNLYSSKNIPGEIIDVLALEEKVLNENPKIADKLLRAWQKAVEYELEHPEEAASIMANRENLTLEEFLTIRKKIKVFSLGEQVPFFSPYSPIREAIEKNKTLLSKTRIIDSSKCNKNFLHKKAFFRVIAGE